MRIKTIIYETKNCTFSLTFSHIYNISRYGLIKYRGSILLDHLGHIYVVRGLIVALREKNSPIGGVRILHVVLIAYGKQSVVVVVPVLDRDPGLFGIVLLFRGDYRKVVRHTPPLSCTSMSSFWTVVFFFLQVKHRQFEFARIVARELSPNDTAPKRASGQSRDRLVLPFFSIPLSHADTRSFAHS